MKRWWIYIWHDPIPPCIASQKHTWSLALQEAVLPKRDSSAQESHHVVYRVDTSVSFHDSLTMFHLSFKAEEAPVGSTLLDCTGCPIIDGTVEEVGNKKDKVMHKVLEKATACVHDVKVIMTKVEDLLDQVTNFQVIYKAMYENQKPAESEADHGLRAQPAPGSHNEWSDRVDRFKWLSSEEIVW